MTAPSTPPPASSTSTSTSTSERGPITYAAAGVDVEAGDKAVELMKESIRRATRPEVLGGLGLILPLATGIAPILTPIAAVGIAILMLGATVVHIRRKESVIPALPLTVVAVEVDGIVRGLLAIGDEVRPTTRAAVDELRRLGLEPVMVTGDNEAVARAVAAEVGITRFAADARPEDKVAEVAALREQGRVVAVVGDGINDAAALAGADLGIAMGGGTDVAIEAADITLLRDDLGTAADAVRLSRATLRVIKQNLGWAFGYNVAAIPLAMAGLLTPMVAGIAMAMSSVCVVGNSLRLRRFR